MTIKFAIFDLDGCLYKDGPHMKDAFRRAATAAVRDCLEKEGRPALDDKTIDDGISAVFKNSSFDAALEAFKINEADMYAAHHANMDENVIEPHPETERAFGGLGVPCAILTYGSKDWAARAVKRIGLETVFPANRIFSIEEIGFQRKHLSAAPFEYALEKLEARAEDCLYADDQPVNLRYAHEIGMTTALVTWGRDVESRHGWQECRDFVDHVCDTPVDTIRLVQALGSDAPTPGGPGKKPPFVFRPQIP